MKKIFVMMLSLMMMFSAAACGNSTENTGEEGSVRQTEEEHSEEEKPETGNPEETTANTEASVSESGSGSNVLVAYFSRAGNLDFDESVDATSSASINMEGSDVFGNAQLLAGMAQEVSGGDLFFIETVGKYPAEYRATTDQAREEQNENARPELASHVENMDAYDTVILIYPNWWGTLPQPVFTFLEEYDFSGKTILPLCTHEGSGLGQSESDIQAICPDAQLLEGLSVRGADAGNARTEVEEWVNRSGILE